VVVHRLRGYVAFALNVKGYVLQALSLFALSGLQVPRQKPQETEKPTAAGLIVTWAMG
jgi:hypothetical protein